MVSQWLLVKPMVHHYHTERLLTVSKPRAITALLSVASACRARRARASRATALSQLRAAASSGVKLVGLKAPGGAASSSAVTR